MTSSNTRVKPRMILLATSLRREVFEVFRDALKNKP